jgi:hypothetical protein
MIEARMQQARREIAMHRPLMPSTFDEQGIPAREGKSESSPFGGW